MVVEVVMLVEGVEKVRQISGSEDFFLVDYSWLSLYRY